MTTLGHRTTLPPMLLTGLHHAWAAVRTLILVAILVPLAGALAWLNLWVFQVLVTAWDLHATGATIPHPLMLQVRGIGLAGAIVAAVFWFFVWRNRHEPEVFVPTFGGLMRGLPRMRVSDRSPVRDRLVMAVFFALYLANGLALFASVIVLLGVGLLVQGVGIPAPKGSSSSHSSP